MSVDGKGGSRSSARWVGKGRVMVRERSYQCPLGWKREGDGKRGAVSVPVGLEKGGGW